MKTLHSLLRSALAVLVLGVAAGASAQVALLTQQNPTTWTYTETFTGLTGAGGAGQPWSNGVTFQGWYADGVPTYSYSDDATAGAIGLYNVGDSALGSYNPKGSTPISFGVKLLNNTGVAIDSFTVSIVSTTFAGNGNNDTTEAYYGFNQTELTSTPVSTPGWTAVTALDLTNTVGTQTWAPAASTWAAGDSLWFQWTDTAANGNGSAEVAHAIETFSISTVGTAIPEPSTYALFLGLGTLGLMAVRRWRARR